jgi:hypothetical protein
MTVLLLLYFLLFLAGRLFSQETAALVLPQKIVNAPSSVKFTPLTQAPLTQAQTPLAQAQTLPVRSPVVQVPFVQEIPGIAVTGEFFSETANYDFYPVNFAGDLRAIAQLQEPAVSELSQWAKTTLFHLEAVIFYMNQNKPAQAWSHLKQLEKFVAELKRLRENLKGKLSQAETPELIPAAAVAVPAVTVAVPTNVALEELLLGLERRVILWGMAIQAETTPSFPLSQYLGKKSVDIQRLKERTLAVENYFLSEKSAAGNIAGNAAANIAGNNREIGLLWCEYLDTHSFLAELDACQKMFNQSNRRISTLVSTIPVPMLISFCDRANVVLFRLNNPNLTDNQRRYLNVPVIAAWQEELANWSADTVTPMSLIRVMERFEETGGMSDMQTLFRLATRLSFSRTPALRQLGLLTSELYGGANVKIYISKVLINHLLPPSQPEVAIFREVIQQQPVFGRRRTDTDIEMNFIPAEDRLLLSLDVSGTVKTTSRANSSITTLLTGGQAEYEARKQIELTEEGFILAPCRVQVRKNRLELLNFQTDFDRVPLLSGLVRSAVRNQYELRQPDAQSETQQKITRQVRERVNREAADRFEKFNEKYRELVGELSERFDLFLEKKDARTETDWLLTSWAIRGHDFLSGNTPAPETPAGAFADLKVHESVINMLVGKLNFDGKIATVGEIRREVAEKFNRPQFAEPGEHDGVQIAFAKYNPIIVRFIDGRIEISIALDSLKIQRQTYRHFKVIVRYRPVVTSENELVLKRDSVINLINVSRGQLVLRTAFTTIFPPNRHFSLNPKFLKNDPRFSGLTTGYCRLEKGWFSVAVIADENPTPSLSNNNSASQNPTSKR